MKTTILAAAAVLALALGTASGFAAAQNNNGNSGVSNSQAEHSGSSNVDEQCDNILANQSAYSRGDVEHCRSQL